MDTDTNNISFEQEGTVSEKEELGELEPQEPHEEEEVIKEEAPKEEEEVVRDEEEIVEVKEDLREEEDNKIVDIESASEDEDDADDGDTTDKPQEDHDHHSDSVKSEGGFKKSDVRCQNFFLQILSSGHTMVDVLEIELIT